MAVWLARRIMLFIDRLRAERRPARPPAGPRAGRGSGTVLADLLDNLPDGPLDRLAGLLDCLADGPRSLPGVLLDDHSSPQDGGLGGLSGILARRRHATLLGSLLQVGLNKVQRLVQH